MARPRKDAEGPKARERIVETFWRLIACEPYAAITIRGLCAEAQVNPNTFYRYFACMDDLAKQAFDENLVDGFPRMLMGMRDKSGVTQSRGGLPVAERKKAGDPADARACRAVRSPVEARGEVDAFGWREDPESRVGASFAACETDVAPCSSGWSLMLDRTTRFNRVRLFAQNGSDVLLGILRRAWVDAWLAEAGKTPDELTREQRIDLLMVAGAEMALASLSGQECTLEDFVDVLDRPLGQTMLAALEGIAAR